MRPTAAPDEAAASFKAVAALPDEAEATPHDKGVAAPNDPSAALEPTFNSSSKWVDLVQRQDAKWGTMPRGLLLGCHSTASPRMRKYLRNG